MLVNCTKIDIFNIFFLLLSRCIRVPIVLGKVISHVVKALLSCCNPKLFPVLSQWAFTIICICYKGQKQQQVKTEGQADRQDKPVTRQSIMPLSGVSDGIHLI